MNRNRNTFMAKREDADVEWFVFDAEGKTLGRLASEIAKVLRGKHKPTFTPHADTGDGVIIINAEKVETTGNKEGQKVYRRYSGYPGGQKVIPYRVMLERKPTFILEHAVKGMMPKKSSLARAQLKRLRIFKGTEHTMQAQKPTKVEI
ncbi:MAG: 50S ribosomal protein L13 [Verrucomicrobia bacterium]|nr:50S ribosomal protein L13 [Verrucomicrobiota bacterium]